jgi:hypothetical protein
VTLVLKVTDMLMVMAGVGTHTTAHRIQVDIQSSMALEIVSTSVFQLHMVVVTRQVVIVILE